MVRRRLLLSVVLVLTGCAQPPPDLVIVGARVWTGDAAQPWAEALSVRGERIAAVGTTQEVRASAGPSTRVIDASGRLVIPGLNDAHLHPGYLPDELMLPGPTPPEHEVTWEDVTARIGEARRTAPPGRWVLGTIGGTVLDDTRAGRRSLDAISGDHPVVLLTWTGHSLIANTLALERLGVSLTQPDPPGGVFAREADGRTLNGYADEYAAMALLSTLVQLVAPEQQHTSLQTIARDAAAFGITSLQVLPHTCTDAGIAELLARPVALRVRMIHMPIMGIGDWRAPTPREEPRPLVTRSGIKFVVDGTPIERSMFISASYSDRGTTRGRLNFSEDDLRAFLRRAFAARQQPVLHAVGDAAIDVILDALDATGGQQWQALRPRIEHGYLFQEHHVARARRVGLIVVANPVHTPIIPELRASIGDRVAGWGQLRTIVSSGVPLALGSDGPLNPYLNLSIATTTAADPLSLEQALRAYTSGAAAAEFAEAEKGTLAPGRLADLAMLSQDIFRVSSDALPRTVSVLTIVNGRVVHEALGSATAACRPGETC